MYLIILLSIPIAAMLPGLIKAAGKVGAYLVSRGDVVRQNKYNSPAEQVKRLREAGLPYWAAQDFENQQTSLPDASSLADAGEGLSGYYQTELDRRRLPILTEELNKIGAEAGLTNNKLQFSNEDVKYLIDEGIIRDGEQITNYRQMKEIEFRMAGVGEALQANEKAVSDIERRIREATEQTEIDKAFADLDAVLKTSKLKDQLFANTEAATTARNEVVRYMKEGGLNIVESLLLMVMQSFSMRAGTGGIDFGN